MQRQYSVGNPEVLPEADSKLGHIVSILSAEESQELHERVDLAERMLSQGGRGVRLQGPAETPA